MEGTKTANHTNRDHSVDPKLLVCAAALIVITSSKNNERRNTEFYFLLTVHPCITLQISSTRCTILLNIFISLPYTFRASTCPSSIGEYCIFYATLVFVTLYGWRLVRWFSNQQTRRQPYRVTNTSVA